MPINCKLQEDFIIVMGNTYPLKDKIKALGGRFNGILKTWEIIYTESSWAAIKQLCEQNGGGAIENNTPESLSEKEAKQQLSNSIQTKIDESPKQIKRISGEIPKSFNLKSSNTSMPKSLESISYDKEGISVSQLMQIAAQKITNAFSMPVWIIGEIQNLSKRGQTFYFALADGVEGKNFAATTTVNGVIWQNSFDMIKAKYGEKILQEILTDGVKIRALAQVSLYQSRGQISISVKDIDTSFTKGALALKREELINELKKNGMYTANKSNGVSEFPLKIGLVSAEGSRAESDFIHQLETGGFPGDIIYYPTPMQGERVPLEIQGAISALAAKNCDLIVITRGGGSAADLRWFDAKEVCYAIGACKIPILSAIGHHDDNTIAEEISFAKSKTPTAAAQYILNLLLETRERIATQTTILASNLERRLNYFVEKNHMIYDKFKACLKQNTITENDKLNHLFYTLDRAVMNSSNEFYNNLISSTHSILNNASAQLSEKQFELVNLKSKINDVSTSSLSSQELSLIKHQGMLEQLNPIPWISKGWTQIYSKEKRSRISRATDLKKENTVLFRLLDGVVEAQVKQIKKK